MNEIGNRPLQELLRVLPACLSGAVLEAGTDELEEIRVRTGRPVQLLYAGDERILPLFADEAFCSLLLENLAEHSTYVRQAELCEGFLTLRGGCRVGVTGRISIGGHMVDVTSFNLRIAREHKGCADGALPLLMKDGALMPTLILSPPGMGKTTLLRDIARQLSNGTDGRRGYKVAIADERSELAGGGGGVPILDVGLRTDVMDGCTKAQAMERMLRSMSPEVIVTDELGNMADAEAVCRASSGGICVLASAHGGAVSDIMRRPYLAPLLGNGCFHQVIQLTRQGSRLGLQVYPLMEAAI